MHSSILVLAVGLLATPLALRVSSNGDAAAAGFPMLAAVQADETVNGRVLTDAPVPSIPPAGLAPVDRVAGAGSRTLDAGPVNSTPFSSTPSGTLSSGGTQASSADRVNAPSDGEGVTPNLGK